MLSVRFFSGRATANAPKSANTAPILSARRPNFLVHRAPEHPLSRPSKIGHFSIVAVRKKSCFRHQKPDTFCFQTGQRGCSQIRQNSLSSVPCAIQFFASASPSQSLNWAVKIGHLGMVSVPKTTQFSRRTAAEIQQTKASGAEQPVKMDSGPLERSPARLSPRWKGKTRERAKTGHDQMTRPLDPKILNDHI